MTYRRPRRGRRPAFTLIEILVVVAIIAILVSLLAAAVMRALSKGPESQTRGDLGNLDSQLSKVQSQFNLKYLPSRLHLSKQNNYGNTQLDLDSKAFLQARFGRDSCYRLQPLSGGTFIDWNGDGNPNEELFLEGEQCLVFHLGGVPLTANGLIKMVGFSTLNGGQNPALPPQSQGERRDGTYFEFQTPRLRPYTSPGSTGAFPVYLDGWFGNSKNPNGQPYVFFSSYGTGGAGNYMKYGASDCASLGVSPYFTAAGPPTLFVNANSWQILSAGFDGTFGPGGLWNPAGSTVAPAEQDDQSNFSPRTLGAAAN